MQLFTDKYAPQQWHAFVGNPSALEQVQKWALAFEHKKTGKPLIFYGSSGTGKTALAILVSKAMGWDLFELNASDLRTKENIERFAGAASMASSFSGKLRLILLDEIDGLSSTDRGASNAIVSILKNSRNPVILTTNDLYGKNLATIRVYCEAIQFKKINYLSIEKYLRYICDAEKIAYEEEALFELAKSCDGDLRAALLDLQTLSFFGKISRKNVSEISDRLKLQDIFKTMHNIFHSKNLADIKKAFAEAKEDNEMLILWIEENIPKALPRKEIPEAYNQFSRGDIFEGRTLNRQYYGFRRYSYDLMSSIAIDKGHESGWIKYQFPAILKQMSSTISSRALNKSICRKIGSKIHASYKSVMQNELPIIKEQFKHEDSAIALSNLFGFEEEEIAFLLDTKHDSKKVQRIFEGLHRQRDANIKEKLTKKQKEENQRQTSLFG